MFLCFPCSNLKIRFRSIFKLMSNKFGYSPFRNIAPYGAIIRIFGYRPFRYIAPYGRLFVFFTVAFLLCLDPTGGSNLAGPIT